MILLENSILIRTSVDTVFDFLAQPETLPKWNYYILEVFSLSGGSHSVGSHFRQVRKYDQQTFEITKAHPNRLLEFVTTNTSHIQFRRQFRFSRHNTHCQLHDHFELDTGHPFFLQNIARNKARRSVKENLTRLKQLLETGQTVLQDGRISSLDNQRAS